jgi:hypothetical protein
LAVADGRYKELGKRLAEWFLRRDALQATRAQVPRRGQLAGRAFDQVGLLREITRQVAETVEEPPCGRRPAVLLCLYRELVYWALVASAGSEAGEPPDLAGLWQRTPRDKLIGAAGGEENLEALRATLLDLSPQASLEATDEDVARVRAFADSLYDQLAAPRRRVAGVIAQRWIRTAAGAAALVAIVLGVRSLALGPNLASRQHMQQSSQLPSCSVDPGCVDLLFHTNQENNPWVQFDLRAPKSIHVIQIRNRPDCCQDRNVPTIAETSLDGIHWKQVARNDKEFTSWTAKFPATVARYVKLRVPKMTMFGFASVTIR